MWSLICLDSTKFLLPCFFTLTQTIFPKILAKTSVTKNEKSLLQVDERRSKTLPTNLCTTVTRRKSQGDRYIQGDSYIQVNFAENRRQLKILGSCPVTVIYRVTRAAIYRFDFTPSGVLPLMAHTEKLRPKGVSCSCFRYMKG